MEVILELFLVGLFISGLFSLPRMIRNEDPLSDQPDWWFLGGSMWAVFERAMPTVTLALGLCMAPLLLILILELEDGPAGRAIAGVLGVGLVIGLIAAVIVGATRRPEALIPIGLREDEPPDA